MNFWLFGLFVIFFLFTADSCRKADGITESGVNESVKAVLWGVLALISLAYLTGWA